MRGLRVRVRAAATRLHSASVFSRMMSASRRVAGPAWGGYLYDQFGMTTPYLTASALLFIAFAVALAGLKDDGAAVPARP